MSEEKRIITLGLTGEQNEKVKECLPSKDYMHLDTNAVTDLIAINAVALIINASKLDKSEIDLLFDFYSEINCNTDEIVLWLGEPEPPKELKRTLKAYKSFDEIADNLKYHFLTAQKQVRKTTDFSKTINHALIILSEIRYNPGITSKKLAERCEISTRSVQRYIETLRTAGEWIEYDSTLKGWKLSAGRSILFGTVDGRELE